MKKPFQLLSVKVTLVFFVTAVVYLYGLTVGIRYLFDTDELRETIGYYQTSYYDYILEDIQYPPNTDKAEEVVGRMPFDMKIVGTDLDWTSSPQFIITDAINFEFSTLNVAKIKADIAEGKPSSREGVEAARYKNRTYAKIPYGDYTIFLVTPKMTVAVQRTYIVEAIIASTLLILLICYVLVQRIFRPIKSIEEGAHQIGQGHLEYRIDVKQKDELGSLAQKINQLAVNVQEMLAAKQRLNLGVSHELRSPLTRARLEVELLEDSKTKEDLLNEINAMETIIANLLDSEAINYGHQKLKFELFELSEMIGQMIQKSGFLSKSNIVFIPLDRAAQVDADKTLFEVMIKNILENAIRYNPAEGKPIQVRIKQVEDTYEIKIRDFGPGFSKEDLTKVTEPFYRTGQSRSRQSGGYGLGLYLCKQIVEAHQGTIGIENHEETGAVVTVIIPKQQNKMDNA
jgi:signal transduction histidine kinase